MPNTSQQIDFPFRPLFSVLFSSNPYLPFTTWAPFPYELWSMWNNVWGRCHQAILQLLEAAQPPQAPTPPLGNAEMQETVPLPEEEMSDTTMDLV